MMRSVLTGVLAFTFSTLTTLLLVVDAPAAVPLFLSMTESDTLEHKRRTAFRAVARRRHRAGRVRRAGRRDLPRARHLAGRLPHRRRRAPVPAGDRHAARAALAPADIPRRGSRRPRPPRHLDLPPRDPDARRPRRDIDGHGAGLARRACLAIHRGLRRDRADVPDHAGLPAQRPARRAPPGPDRHERPPARDGPDPRRDGGTIRGRRGGDVAADDRGGVGERAASTRETTFATPRRNPFGPQTR